MFLAQESRERKRSRDIIYLYHHKVGNLLCFLRRVNGRDLEVPEALGVLEDCTIRAELAHLLESYFSNQLGTE